jgi:hypothetical protein
MQRARMELRLGQPEWQPLRARREGANRQPKDKHGDHG